MIGKDSTYPRFLKKQSAYQYRKSRGSWRRAKLSFTPCEAMANKNNPPQNCHRVHEKSQNGAYLLSAPSKISEGSQSGFFNERIVAHRKLERNVSISFCVRQNSSRLILADNCRTS